MNTRCLILVAAALWMSQLICRGAETPVIPDGEYRDAAGLAVLVIQGKTAVLKTSLLAEPMEVSGSLSVMSDGAFFINGTALASNQWDALFGRRRWTWMKDHFVVTETVPPARTLQLRRK